MVSNYEILSAIAELEGEAGWYPVARRLSAKDVIIEENLVRVLNGLAERGYLERRPPEQGAHERYALTEAGRDFLAHAGAAPAAPPSAAVNAAAWQAMQGEWDRLVRDGRQVKVDIQVIHAPDGERLPALCDVRYSVDGLPFCHTFRYAGGPPVDGAARSATTEALALALRDIVAAAIGPAEWQSATVRAVIASDDEGLIAGRYLSAGEERGFATDHRLYMVFDELRRRQRAERGRAWGDALYTLQPDGGSRLEESAPEA